MQQLDLMETQKLIEKLDGVLAAKLSCDEQGSLCEVHILADRSKSPKQLSRDIQSAVAAASGMDVEHRIISIAQIGEATAKSDERLSISNISVSNGAAGFQVSVELSLGADTYRGNASAAGGGSGVYHTVALACVNALREYAPAVRFAVSDVVRVRIAGSEEINVALSYTDRGMERLLTGTALVQGDAYQTVVKATLDAVNRILFHFAS